MRDFVLGDSVHANVLALRIALGSRTRALSLLDFARVLNERDGRKRAASTVQKWEQSAEPDLESIRLMAEIAGVSFEEFALGSARSGAAGGSPPGRFANLADEGQAKVGAPAKRAPVAKRAPAAAFKKASAAEEDQKVQRAGKRRA